MPDSLTNRVATACLKALRPHGLAHDRMFVTRLIRQLARQELVPEDLDNENGVDAIGAIAEAIITAKTTSSDVAITGVIDHVWRDVYDAVMRAL